MAYRPFSPLNIPKQSYNEYNINYFLGADLTSEKANVNAFRSPYCPNMIRETIGKVRKWIGYHTTKKFPYRINGVFTLKADKDYMIIHSGTNIYLDNTDNLLYGDANDIKSMAFTLDKKLYFADGKKLLLIGIFDGEIKVKKVEDFAYVPTTYISKNPKGDGVFYEPVNLLNPKRTESFLADGTSLLYKLNEENIDEITPTVSVLNSDLSKIQLTHKADFTVDYKKGIISFLKAPQSPEIMGKDNVFITYEKTTDGSKDKINHCTIGILYGVEGGRNRLFLSGNNDLPNYDFYCDVNNPTYFGDKWYSILGSDNSKIIGYSIVNDKLATHLDYCENNTNIIMRKAIMKDNTPLFILDNMLQGADAISKFGFAFLENEPLFLSNEGIFAITPSDIMDERYSQLRSYYLNGLLLKQDLTEAYACSFNGFYMVACGEYIFALDGTQGTTENNKPYSHRQYEGYYRTGINARVLFISNDKLCFGRDNGEICEFFTDYNNINNFSDNGKQIKAIWQTPEIIGKSFYSEKIFRNIAVYLGVALATGVRIYGVYDGVKTLLLDYNAKARYFDFSNINFSKLSFCTDKTPQIIGGKRDGKIKIKNAQGISIIFENDILNEPLALYSANVRFSEKY